MNDVRITTALIDALAAIPRWYGEAGRPPRAAATTTRAPYASKPPVSAEAASARRAAVDALTSWALLVTQERGLQPTTPCARPRDRRVFGPAPRTGWPRECGCARQTGQLLIDGNAHRLVAGDVPVLASFLSTHADWLAGFDGLAALRQLEAIARDLEQIVKQSRPSRVKVAEACPEPGCSGRLIASVRRGDDVLPSAVRCNVAPRDHVWEPHDWPALGRRTTPLRASGVRRLLAALGDTVLPREFGAATVAPTGRDVVPGVLSGVIYEADDESGDTHGDAPGAVSA